VADQEKLKREQAGTYRTADGRFTVEQSSTGWLVLDSEQTNELGLPLARGPFATLDDARGALADARSGPRPISDLDERRRAPAPSKPAPGAKASAREQERPRSARAGTARRAAKRATGLELVIREIRTADGDALRALWKSVGFQSVGDDDRSLARLARRNPGLVLVATEGSRIVGSALGAWDGRRGWIYHVATAEDHRRRGVATKLLDRIEAGLADLGCAKVNVVVRVEGEAGRAFWKARGYVLGSSRHYGKELDGG
jgi:ribosomal protein S18 acetylase RimI-like enzyme